MTNAGIAKVTATIDDTKIKLIRGPYSCRNVAVSYLQMIRERFVATAAAGIEVPDDLEQAIAWLQKLDVAALMPKPNPPGD